MNILKERYPGEYQANLDRKKANRAKAAQAQEEQRQRLLLKSGTRAEAKPDNMPELMKEAERKFKPINSKQFSKK